jgi:beta-lactamase class A
MDAMRRAALFAAATLAAGGAGVGGAATAGGAATLGGAAGARASASAARWQPGILAAERYAEGRRGAISFAVRTECGGWGRRQDRAVPSASVLKAMLLLAYLQRGDVRARPLTREQRALLDPMIRRSDNDAATRVLALVGGAQHLQHDASGWGMTRFKAINNPWGDSSITARDQARFFLHYDRRLPPRHRAYALTLLRTIVPSQRWGIGRVAPRGWTLHFKGGWGSGTGRVDHQVALLTRGDQRVSLAILTTADGTHAYGKRTLQGVAQRLLRGLSGRATVC